jgi:polar amino acid transport system substrate-binding protein
MPNGYTLEPVMVPWLRAQEMARAGRIDLLVNIRITPERSAWLTFSRNPTFSNPIVVFMRRDRQIPFRSWDELQPLLGGTALGDNYGNGFDEYLAAKLTTQSAPTMVENFRKLDAGRIDYFVSGYYMGHAWLQLSGLDRRIVALDPPVSDNSINLAFNKKSPHVGLLPEIDRNLARLQADGTPDRLLRKYLKVYAASQSKDMQR